MAVDTHSPASLLEAALNGELSLDGEQAEPKAQEVEDRQEADDTATDEQDGKEEAQATDEPEGAPIASKSGTYTIPFEKLSQARTERDQFKAEVESLRSQLEGLSAKQQQNLSQAQEQAQARADAGQDQTKVDRQLDAAQDAISNGVDPDIFGDFSEDGIAKGIKTLLAQAVPALRAELKAEMEKELAPLKTERAKAQVDSHMGSIYGKHADADEIAESDQFKQWIAGLPGFMRSGVNDAMSKGTAEQVIEVFDSFKAQNGKPPPAATTKPDVQRRGPVSLSEINGAPPVDLAQQVLQTAGNPGALLSRMMDGSLTPEQIEAVMNRV